MIYVIYMLYPGECLILIENEQGYRREDISICKDDVLEIEYFAATDKYIIPLIELFQKYYLLLYKLTDIMIRDLEGLRGTHAWKNRTIARLKKFIRILKEIGGDYKLGYVSLYTLFEYKLHDLEEIIRALETVKGEFHRVRDPVHELFYPYIRRILKDLQEIRIRYIIRSDSMVKLYYQVELTKYGFEVREDFDDKKRGYGYSTSVNLDKIKEIIEKRKNRRRRNRLYRKFWDFIEGKIWWDPLIPSTTEDFFSFIDEKPKLNMVKG